MGRHQVVAHVAVPVELAIVFVAAAVRVNAPRTAGAQPPQAFSLGKLLGVTNRCGVKKCKGITLSIQSVGMLKALYTSLPGRPVHSDTNSTSPGSILARQQLRTKTIRLHFHCYL